MLRKIWRGFVLLIVLLTSLPAFAANVEQNILEAPPYNLMLENKEYCSLGSIGTFDISEGGNVIVTIQAPINIFKWYSTYYINLYSPDYQWKSTFKIEYNGYAAAHFNKEDIELYLARSTQMLVLSENGALISVKNRDLDTTDLQKAIIEKDGLVYYCDALGKKIYYRDYENSDGKKVVVFELASSFWSIVISFLPVIITMLVIGVPILLMIKKRDRNIINTAKIYLKKIYSFNFEILHVEYSFFEFYVRVKVIDTSDIPQFKLVIKKKDGQWKVVEDQNSNRLRQSN